MPASDYTVQTEAMQRAGLRVFQGAMFDDDESVHCKTMYEQFGIPTGALLVDMGCGIGEVSRHFCTLDPTLKCVGVSNEKVQISQLPEMIHGVLSDFENTPLADDCADAVMFNESFGYGDARALLHEASRLLKPGGLLCIKDFSFDRYTPIVSERLRAWGYTVHDPDALAAYAQAQGFEVVRILPRLECSFTRWSEMCEASAEFHRHRHTQDPGNLFAAVYVFRKPISVAIDRAAVLAHGLHGNQDAIHLVNQWYKVLHLWDDLVDGDKPVTREQINAAFTLALVDIPANPFFRENMAQLLPLLSSGITSWHVANVMERSGNRELLAQAHMHRIQIGSVFVACAEIIGGRDWAIQVGPYLWQLTQGDRLSDYVREIEMKNQTVLKGQQHAN
ncbi:MAG: class I SAM-dependent methyltransferase [Polaromonas sp.]|jgi:ubiquinone/menaquinone biosynthesis C-methylase UbiE